MKFSDIVKIILTILSAPFYIPLFILSKYSQLDVKRPILDEITLSQSARIFVYGWLAAAIPVLIIAQIFWK